ncbi:MAG: PH domain-containing protein [Planctomycetes bacterium]|nr:PH domain-containing protein [Planctomycetota bacterium]
MAAKSAVPEAEVEVWVGRTHWKYFASRLLAWAAMNLAAAVLAGWWAWSSPTIAAGGAAAMIAGWVAVTGLFIVGGVVVRVLSTRYRLTSQRLFVERGILSQTVDQTELIRVDDVRIEKSLLNRMVGVGNVTLLTTDTTDRSVSLVGVAEPDRVAELVRNHMRTLRHGSLFVENL